MLILGIIGFLLSIGIINVCRNYINWKKIEKEAELDGKITKDEEKLIKDSRKLFFKSFLNMLSMAFKTKINKKTTPNQLIDKINEKIL